MPLAYEDLVTRPRDVMSAVAEFIGCTFQTELYSAIHSKSLRRAESRLAPDVTTLCDAMYDRLRDAQKRWQETTGISI